jgi:hypothetical protein
MRTMLFRRLAVIVVVMMGITTSMTTFAQQSEVGLDKRFGQYAEMNASQKVTAFKAETAATQAALMRRNVWAKSNQITPPLSDAKKDFLRVFYRRLTAEAYTEGTPENEELKSMSAEAERLFSPSELKALFSVKDLAVGAKNNIFLSEISYKINFKSMAPRPSTANYNCYCISSYYDCPSGGYSCELNMHNCTAAGSCGFAGLYTCRGGCKYTGAEMVLEGQET